MGIRETDLPNPGQGSAPPDSSAKRTIERLAMEMGDVALHAFNDPQTIELMLNPDGSLWVERLGEPLKHIGHMQESVAQTILRTIAGFHGEIITESSPRLECNFPIDGSRFAGQIPPVVRAPSFAIRKRASSVFTIDEYVEKKIMTREQAALIKGLIADRRNILIAGGTSSGKTTLLNAVAAEQVHVSPDDRFLIVEDTQELQVSAKNKVEFKTTKTVDSGELLRTSLRMRPDRILFGEVRGKEALDMLMAWNTGHEGGAATIHANTPESTLSRLYMAVSMHSNAPREIEPLIGEAVHAVVHIAKTKEHGRRITGIMELNGFQDGRYLLRNV
ncbi:P-type conjugative transfer ATPase TrbB [Pandoraea apista]|uniref:P-type conjugative transfer ATPase TrbB n=2 Tax=Pandoraea apista TaxID=93218 RepID=UPI0009325286|nr:P-type conjugative transfer ATPase TrbB [Pandoraea apista]